MEQRTYFIVGDFFSSTMMGAFVGLGVAGIVGEGWSMRMGMLVGMIVGMGMSLPALLVFCPLFGGLEIILPIMLTGMVAGMGIGMVAAMQGVYLSTAAGIGALIGTGVILGTYMLNARLQGEAREWT
jgi:hypothetical protein